MHTKPFAFEGPIRKKRAIEGIKELKKNCDTLLVIPNETLLGLADHSTTVTESFKLADSVLNQATKGISDLINNAATAVIMAPVSVQVANQMGQPIEPFLMAVAVGASCAFLSPIGHQCNTLVMGPGNYRFADYWKLGLPLEILIVCISIPVIMNTWF